MGEIIPTTITLEVDGKKVGDSELNDFPAGQDFECDTVRTSCTVYLGNALSKSIAIKAVRENNVYEETVEVGLDKCNKVYIGLPELFPNF